VIISLIMLGRLLVSPVAARNWSGRAVVVLPPTNEVVAVAHQEMADALLQLRVQLHELGAVDPAAPRPAVDAANRGNAAVSVR
jgi:hypothetical protein